MFEIAIYLAILLIGVTVTTYHYLSEKVDSHLKRETNKFSEEFAQNLSKQYEELFKKYKTTEPPIQEIKKFYSDLMKTALEMRGELNSIEKLRYVLNSAITFFSLAIVCLLVTGVVSYSQYSVYAFPTFLVGIILIIPALCCIYKIMTS